MYQRHLRQLQAFAQLLHNQILQAAALIGPAARAHGVRAIAPLRDGVHEGTAVAAQGTVPRRLAQPIHPEQGFPNRPGEQVAQAVRDALSDCRHAVLNDHFNQVDDFSDEPRSSSPAKPEARLYTRTTASSPACNSKDPQARRVYYGYITRSWR
jgi:hypothetical protein